MFNPDLSKVLKNRVSRYSLVVATAKRARNIAEESEENHEILEDKTVSMAMDEILEGKYAVVEPEEIRGL